MKKTKINFKPWTEDDIKYLRDNFRKMSFKDLGDNLERSPLGIKRKLKALNLQRTEAEYKTIILKYCSKHQFNINPIEETVDGLKVSVRYHSGGKAYKHIKLESGKWIKLNVYLYEKKYGKLKDGEFLISLTGDTLDADPENWAVYTRKDLGSRVGKLKRNKNALEIDGFPIEKRYFQGHFIYFIKISTGYWVPVYNYLYKKKFGPIPRGYYLECISDDPLNYNLDNWKLKKIGGGDAEVGSLSLAPYIKESKEIKIPLPGGGTKTIRGSNDRGKIPIRIDDRTVVLARPGTPKEKLKRFSVYN